jgi:hypothetical protein
MVTAATAIGQGNATREAREARDDKRKGGEGESFEHHDGG